jgi:hypothetical protein
MKNLNQSQQTNLAILTSRPEISSIGKLKKLYSLFFESASAFSTATTELQKHLAKGRIPLQALKEQAREIEKVIGTLGSITLAVEPPLDEIAIVQEIKERLCLKEPCRINYLESRIHTLVAEISTSYKDKNLNTCLNHLKGKAWNLLEELIDYAKNEYNSSITL